MANEEFGDLLRKALLDLARVAVVRRLHPLMEGLEVADVGVDQRTKEDNERREVTNHVPLDNAQGLESISSFAWLARVCVT